MEGIGENLAKIGQLDVSLKIGLFGGACLSAAAAITLPTTKEKERAAEALFKRPLTKLTPVERKTAEFHAGYERWQGFMETKVYPVTRKLPGAQNPILNPYRGLEPLGGQGDDDE
jgi:hypothetical protein